MLIVTYIFYDEKKNHFKQKLFLWPQVLFKGYFGSGLFLGIRKIRQINYSVEHL